MDKYIIMYTSFGEGEWLIVDAYSTEEALAEAREKLEDYEYDAITYVARITADFTV